jgi:hypothetical protein
MMRSRVVSVHVVKYVNASSSGRSTPTVFHDKAENIARTVKNGLGAGAGGAGGAGGAVAGHPGEAGVAFLRAMIMSFRDGVHDHPAPTVETAGAGRRCRD